MAQGRARTARSSRGGGKGVPWLGLALLGVIGVAVFVARATEPAGRVAAPTPTVARATTPQPVAQAKPTAVAVPTATRASATAPPTHVATAAPTHVPTAAPTHAPAATAATAPVVRVSPVAVASAEPAAAGSVALTFDAGADRGYAEDILDTLQAEHVVASFGITGQWAKANPDLVRRMAADGHLVFNHTLDHRSFTGVSDQRGGLSATRRRAELEDADAIIGPLLGHSTQPWYRLPYGDDDAQVAADVHAAGYTRKVGWTVDSLGWRGLQAADIVARCLKLAAPGGVYVFHVGHASQDSLALAQIIHGLRDRGLAFHRVDQA